VEIALLIDVYHQIGIEAMTQVDLDVRQNRHQPLAALSPMASAVAGAVAARLVREGRLHAELPDIVERPPLASTPWGRSRQPADRWTSAPSGSR
jgi:hypothetical protein